MFVAQIVEVKQLSSNVRYLRLRLLLDKKRPFTFYPGQYIDFQIEGIDKVGGYSLISAPETSNIELAVKNSDFPPTAWIHSDQCQVGVNVLVSEPEGNFYFSWPWPITTTSSSAADHHHQAWIQQLHEAPNLLLIAGGVGVNPIYSIWQYVSQNDQLNNRMFLLQSAKDSENLQFKNEINKIVKENPSKYQARWFTTQQQDEETKEVEIVHRRIEENDIKQAMEWLGDKVFLCYICGPQQMSVSFKNVLQNLGVEEKYILSETWW